MRARWIRPEYYRDRKIAQLGVTAAFVFPALWCSADDGGVCRADPVLIKGEMFAFWESITAELIAAALAQLERAGRIRLYTIADEQYAEILNFLKHQGKIHKASKFRHPRPETTEESALKLQHSGTAPALLPESTGTPHHLNSSIAQYLNSSTPTTNEGLEKRDEKAEQQNTSPTPKYSKEFEEFWKVYPVRAGGANKSGALRMWNARTAEGLASSFLIERAKTYGAWCTAEKIIGTTKVMMASTFLGRDRRYEDDYTVSSLKLEPASASGSRSEPKPYSRDWLQKNGYPLPPLGAEEVA